MVLGFRRCFTKSSFVVSFLMYFASVLFLVQSEIEEKNWGLLNQTHTKETEQLS